MGKMADEEVAKQEETAAGGEGGEETPASTVPAVSEDDRKLFVGGLPQEAKDLDIKEYFGQYGEIDNINLKTDPHTGRSRGFAFIVFKDTEGLKAEAKQGKIYVGKLPTEGVSVEDIQNYFAQFGP